MEATLSSAWNLQQGTHSHKAKPSHQNTLWAQVKFMLREEMLNSHLKDKSESKDPQEGLCTTLEKYF